MVEWYVGQDRAFKYFDGINVVLYQIYSVSVFDILCIKYDSKLKINYNSLHVYITIVSTSCGMYWYFVYLLKTEIDAYIIQEYFRIMSEATSTQHRGEFDKNG